MKRIVAPRGEHRFAHRAGLLDRSLAVAGTPGDVVAVDPASDEALAPGGLERPVRIGRIEYRAVTPDAEYRLVPTRIEAIAFLALGPAGGAEIGFRRMRRIGFAPLAPPEFLVVRRQASPQRGDVPHRVGGGETALA